MKRMALVAVVVALGMSSACIELTQLITGVIADSTGGPPPPSDGVDPNGNGGGAPGPEVRLSVSNPNPTINEEVVLTCRSVSTTQAATNFSFQPAGVVFGVNSITGTAFFIPSEPDAGTSFEFTCTGTNADGTGPASTPIVVIPVGTGEG